ncbi:hypothetical protein [Roseibium sp.]|uniref:hypothetical protein n=1 Tax=Roseibium sp. TaxID=1936156 RepID=UPI003B50D21B
MEEPFTEVEALAKLISERAQEMEHPAGHDICLLIASELIETAGKLLADHETGNRVSELMLLSARVENLMKARASR